MTEPFRTIEMSDPAYERDGLRLITVRSKHLQGRGDVSVWAPKAEQISTLLILLHGVYGSHWVWSLKGGVHRVAQRMVEAQEIHPMVIAMPSDALLGEGSGYLAWPDADVEQWIVDEVPEIARHAVPALRNDAKIAIAGLSMGGYGALRLGAKFPELYSSISAHSSFTSIEEISAFVEEPIESYLQCARREELTCLYWLRKNRDRLPALRFDCGQEDHLIGTNRELHRALLALNIDHEFDEFAGAHDWPYWETHVTATLRHADRHSRRGPFDEAT